MRGRVAPVHFAHMPGPCGLAISPCGSYALSSGPDASLRAHDTRDPASPAAWWRHEPPAEPELPDLSITDLHEKAVGALALSPDNLTMATGSDDGFVRVFSVAKSLAPRPPPAPADADASARPDALTVDGELVQACARFGGPVRAVAFSPTGSFLAAAGDEPGVVKIIMTAQPSNVNVLRATPGAAGQQATVALAFDPKSDYVAAIGEKGQSVVWDVQKCTVASAVELNDRNANCVAWSPSGDALVYGTDKGVVLVNRETWMFDCLLEDAGDRDDDDDLFANASGKDNISAVAWSANGRYLLAAREDSNISLWDLHDKKVLGAWKSEDVAQKIIWHPKSNAFILIDKIGQWGIVPDVVPKHMPAPQSDAHVLQLPSLPDTGGKTKKKSKPGGDDDDDDTIVKRSKSGKLRRKKKHLASNAAQKKSAKDARKKKEVSEAEDEDQELENGFTFNASDVEADDEEQLSHERQHDDSEASGDTEEESESDEEVDGELADLENAGVRLPRRKRKSRRTRPAAASGRSHALAVAQEPFMPSSTPLSEKQLRKKHILVWNLVGAVLSFGEDSHDIIEIEFAEASKRTVGIKDHFGYTMGCLTETGVFLASKRSKEHGSLVTFRPFSSWANSADWTQFLQQEEDISAIALGQRFAAVATTPNNIVRLFSLSGIQTSVFGVPGTVITTAASGDRLVVVYAEQGTAALKCESLEISSTGDVEKISYTGSLVMCPGSKLEWVGFTSDTGELCSYDSQGWLWLLTDPRSSRRWIPMLQNAAKAGECDWFWVASATSNSLIGVPCLSNERYPAAKPRPALRSLSLVAPVIERVTKSGKPTVIERLARTKLNLLRALAAKAEVDELYESGDDEVADAEERVSRMELETDKCLLSLMEDACKREQNMRALDLATRLHCGVSFKYAVELAKHYKRSALATRVEHVAIRKLVVIQDDEYGRQTSSTKLRTSPVTPQSNVRPSREDGKRGSNAGIADKSDRETKKGSTRAQMTRINFDADEAESPVQPKKRLERNNDTMTVADVTDDEEEDAVRTESESKPEAPERTSPAHKAEVEKAKKRSAPMPASQASVKGAAPVDGNSSKKPRITELTKGKAGKSAKRSFHNRFLKK